MTRTGSRYVVIALVLVLAAMAPVPNVGAAGQVVAAGALAQGPADACAPLVERRPATPRPASSPVTAGLADPAPAPAERTSVTVGFVPISIYAPLFVAFEKGYYADEGLDVTLEPLAGGSDLITLTANGEFDVAAAGAGPAFWNAMALDLPVTVVAPGHAEGSPVATPLMISREACESGAITRVADLRGKRVSVNAPGATEFWLGRALATDGLTIDDVDEQFLAFPEAVAALASGAIDAAMVGEPLATQAEQQGIASRLLDDFPVQDVQPTTVIANDGFLADHPDAANGFAVAYLRAVRDLSGAGFKAPENLAIIERYTGVPADLVAEAVQPVFVPNGVIDLASLGELQTFFRGRGQLEYETDIDPGTIVDLRYMDAALARLGPYAS
ncbi:MAG: hypothetical protein AVDCRST_MAG49-2007 [uncultured Thermomicrobiales bacterium]|uniref:SsuA/THI5-like domain-containing protein n=1 Tax=uncultured Thermomicrobiales bacterium TaxID=1645740 RepID=A0A6J4UME6_9BACT|nr:MAG: hypothetical protein AVDCRST_MAG49-2007 [uncultured Thermomicrobiales bacterium]